jgi:hypothetical protein
MDQICLVIPILAGKSDDARDFMRELEQSRKADYALVAYMESRDFPEALKLFSQSQDEFDLWFKRRLADSTGVDLNNPPEMTLPELLSSYEAGAAAVP